MKKIFAFGAAAMALAMTSCSSEESIGDIISNLGKEKIQLAAGDDQNTVMTTRAGFKEQTGITAHIVSEPRNGAPVGSVVEYTRTYLYAEPGAQTDAGFSNVKYGNTYTRYWDDAHGRYSRLSVYAVAVPNEEIANTAMTGTGGESWETGTVDNTVGWSLHEAQTTETLATDDLTYSNNIQETGKGGVYKWDFNAGKYNDADPSKAGENEYNDGVAKTDGRLYFTQADKNIKDNVTDAAGHFQKGHLIFKHALSSIQVKIQKGTGFGTSAFAFTSGNIQLNNMPYEGRLDVKDGTWSVEKRGKIASIAKISSETDAEGTYEALTLPGYNFNGTATDNALEFTIDNNTYHITNAQLKAALDGITSSYVTEQGKRYIFTIIVDKTEIKNITATIVDWTNVEANETTVDNSHLDFTFYENGAACTDVNLFKYEQGLGTIVTTNANYEAAPSAGWGYTPVALVGSEAPYSTGEYYKDNKTAYHFRSLNDDAANALNSGKTAFTMTAGTDYHWGAPMTYGISSIPYSTSNGYYSSIAKGIVAASGTSQILLTELHMMSELVVKLTTPSDGSAVDLTDATVTLTKFSQTGTVDMSTGKITPGEVVATGTVVSAGDNTFKLYVVPQALVRNTATDKYIGITIHTKDNNEYYIVKNLSDITAKTVGTEVTNKQTEGAKITEWFPGHRYTYTFKITKTQIKNITATIAAWNEIVADDTTLDLEK